MSLMTSEEAIKELDTFKIMAKSESGERALNMAIKALEQEPTIDKIRAEFISRYPKNYMGEPECGGASCVFSLDKVLEIIDKYKAESEVQDADSN